MPPESEHPVLDESREKLTGNPEVAVADGV